MAQLRLSLLGPFQVTMNGEPVTMLSSSKIRALLAYLAVEKRPHPRRMLAELLWPERPAGMAAQNLRQSVSRLSRALQSPGDLDFILSTRQIVALNPAADVWLDAAAFTEGIEFVRVHHHRNVTRCRTCSVRLSEVIALYRGDFLEEVIADSPAFEEWATLQREWFHGQALGALDQLAAHYLWLGDFQTAQEYARRQLELEPWLENGYRQLMSALAGMGRRSEALALYDVCRQTLAENLGVAPSAQTTALYESIKHEALLTQEELILTGIDNLVLSPPKDPVPKNNLPRQFTPFVGREREQAEIQQRLDLESCALMTIIGPGGVGKTRLAVEVARRRLPQHPDGICFVPLAAVPDASLLPVTIATHMDLTLSGTADPATQLITHLRSRRMLLVLDNVEHLHDSLEMLMDLLREALDVKLLVTSRVALNLRAEWLYEVSGLAFPKDPDTVEHSAATDLFIQAAQQLSQDYKPGTEWASIVQICQMVEGLPLALELAASQVRGASCRQIARSISENLDHLATSMSDVPVRQRSLRAVFNSSWALLSPQGKAVLSRLSQFVGGFTAEAAAVVASARQDALDELLDKSFLRLGENERYQMHEVLRQYSAELLGSEAEEVSKRHADYYAGFTEMQHKELNSDKQKQALAVMNADFDNVLAAWRWSLERQELLLLGRFTDGLWAYLDDRGLYRDGLALFERALASMPENEVMEAAGGEGYRVWTYLRLAAGFFHQRLGQYPQARRNYEQCLQAYRRMGDLMQSAHCLYYLGGIASNAGRLDEALVNLKECLVLYHQLESDRHIANTLTKMGSVLELMGRYREAEEILRQALALKRESNQPLGIAISLNNLALLLWRTGRYEEAEELFRESLDISREIGNSGNIASALSNLGRLLITRGEYHQAKALLQESLVLEQTVQNKRHTASVFNYLGLVSHLLGESAPVHGYLAQALALAQETGNQREEAYTRLTMGRILLDEGNQEGGGRSLRRTLQLAAKLRLTPLALAALVQTARLLASKGQSAKAVDVLQHPLHHPASWLQTRNEAAALAEELTLPQKEAGVPTVADLWETIADLIETI